MITIYKFPLGVQDEQWIEVPRGAKPLSVQVQNETPCLWMQVDTDAPATDSILIVIHGTGHPMKSDKMKFIGTFQIGWFVGHVFVP